MTQVITPEFLAELNELVNRFGTTISALQSDIVLGSTALRGTDVVEAGRRLTNARLTLEEVLGPTASRIQAWHDEARDRVNAVTTPAPAPAPVEKPAPIEKPPRLPAEFEADMYLVQAIGAGNAPAQYERLHALLGELNYNNYVALYGPGQIYWDGQAVQAATRAHAGH
jgi:hypothetical protein